MIYDENDEELNRALDRIADFICGARIGFGNLGLGHDDFPETLERDRVISVAASVPETTNDLLAERADDNDSEALEELQRRSDLIRTAFGLEPER